MSYINHPTLGSIECVRSLRSRSIRLTLRSNGMLRLSYPIFTSAREALAFAESKSEWIENTRNKINQRSVERPTITLHEGMELRRGAQRELPTLTERLAREHGFSYASLRISSARTRWGSCSGKNGISLSLFVMILPQHLREFIILHELMPYAPSQPLHSLSLAARQLRRRPREGVCQGAEAVAHPADKIVSCLAQ